MAAKLPHCKFSTCTQRNKFLLKKKLVSQNELNTKYQLMKTITSARYEFCSELLPSA
jgi:hypothetical protein